MARKSVKQLAPMHPGEVLREEFLFPFEISAGALSKVCGVPRTRIERLANEETGVTADTALRLAKAFGTTTALWLNLQNDYDVQMGAHRGGLTPPRASGSFRIRNSVFQPDAQQ
jgi:addiction module HigA family antidote